jgi:hypothetical protein
VKRLGKVENLVCRILRSFSTGDKNGFDVHDERGKYDNGNVLNRISMDIAPFITNLSDEI